MWACHTLAAAEPFLAIRFPRIPPVSRDASYIAAQGKGIVRPRHRCVTQQTTVRRVTRDAVANLLAAFRWNDTIHPQVLNYLSVMILRMQQRVDDESGARPAWLGADDLRAVRDCNSCCRAVQVRKRSAQIFHDLHLG